MSAMLQKLVFFFGLFFLLVHLSYSQQCTSTFFQTSFQHISTQGPQQIVPLSSGNIITGGSTAYGFNVTKLNKSGDTLFTKFINAAGTGNGLNAQLSQDSSGKLLVLYRNRIFSLDTISTLLSVQRLLPSQLNPQMEIKKIGVMANGDKVILIEASTGFFLIRTNAALTNIVWNKYFTFNSSVCKDFFIDFDKIIVTGNTNTTTTINSPFVASIDANGGTLIKLIVYNPEEAVGTSSETIFKSGNQYISIIYMPGATVTNGKYFFLRLDTALNVISSKRMIPSVQSAVRDLTYFFTPNADGSFIGIGGQSQTSILQNIIFSIDNRDSLSWIKLLQLALIQPSDLKQNKDGILAAGFGNYNNVVLNRTESYFSIIKTNFNGSIACRGSLGGDLNLKEYGFSIFSTNMQPVVKDSVFSFVSDAATYAYPILNLSPNCVEISNPCGQLKLAGNTSICGNGPLIITGKRNAGCYNKVEWSINSAQATMLTVNSDSTVSIRFTKSGIYKIKGSVNGDCGVQEDSLLIQVSIPTLNLGVDTVLCSGTMKLHAGNQFKQYKWQDMSTDSVLTINSPGTYFVSVTDNCNYTYSDTIVISAGKAYQFASLSSVLICQGNSAQLKAPDDFLSYSWSPNYAMSNSNSQTTVVSPAINTNYIVTMKDANGCNASDTFQVNVQSLPVLKLPADTLLCDNATLLLMATQNNTGSKYTWQDASSTDTLLVNKPGTYIVKVETNGCFFSDTSKVRYLQTPTVYLGNDTLKCKEDIIHLNAFFAGATYLWQDNSQLSTYDVYKAGIYHCKVSNFCGSVSDSVIVKDQICECEPIIPNAFSPNADGINDEFKPYIKCISTFFQIQVFDRAGQVVFETNDTGKYWDGTFKNKKVPIGTYYYILKLRGVSDVDVKIRSGSILLLR